MYMCIAIYAWLISIKLLAILKSYGNVQYQMYFMKIYIAS